MLDNSVLPREVLRHGAYACLRLADGADPRAVAAVAVPALAEKLGLVNEFEPAQGPPAQSIAFLRRNGATSGAIADGPGCSCGTAAAASPPVPADRRSVGGGGRAKSDAVVEGRCRHNHHASARSTSPLNPCPRRKVMD